MQNIWFIRHGESESNAGLPSKDPGSPPLTNKGQEQAQNLARYIVDEPDLIVTSSYVRTIETAAPTREKFPNVPTEIWPVEEFTYLSSPSYKDTTVSQRRSAGIHYWRRGNPDHRDGPGAESFNDLLARSQETLRLIKENPSENILIFSHGWFIRAILYTLITQSKGNPEYQGDLVKQLRKDKYISAFLKTYLSLRKLPPENRKMLHYLLFSSIKIPNTTIFKFQYEEDIGFKFLEKYTGHIPKTLNGNFFLDR